MPLIYARRRRNWRHIITQSIHHDTAIAQIRFITFVKTHYCMLHPVIVVAVLEVVPRVCPAALLAGLRGEHGVRALHEEVLQLEGLDEVSVPNE